MLHPRAARPARAVRDPEVAWFDKSRKEFKALSLHEQLEVLTLAGDITVDPEAIPPSTRTS